MKQFTMPADRDALKIYVGKILTPIKPADNSTLARKNFLFDMHRSDAGRTLAPYYLVYFLLVELLEFRNLGKFEKVAWSIPIDYEGKAFMIEHRKFGIGLFVQDKDVDEPAALHLAIVGRNLWSGEAIAALARAEWQEKYKAAVTLNSAAAKNFYDQLTVIRRQLRNFIAHGAFGKNGEAFDFHSGAGAVPVRLVTEKGNNRFTFMNALAFDDQEVMMLLEKFVAFLRNDDLALAMRYCQDKELPSILTLVAKGKYAAAMQSEEDMDGLIEYLIYQFDSAANMDW